MRFRDILAVARPQIPRPLPVAPWDLQSDAARSTAADLEVFADELDPAWQSYLTSGGFPRAVAEHTRTGTVSTTFLEDLKAWLHRDGPMDSIPRLLAEPHARSTAPLNRTAIASELSYPNRQTFDLRLNRLVRNFAAVWCHQISDTGTRVSGPPTSRTRPGPSQPPPCPAARLSHPPKNGEAPIRPSNTLAGGPNPNPYPVRGPGSPSAACRPGDPTSATPPLRTEQAQRDDGDPVCTPIRLGPSGDDRRVQQIVAELPTQPGEMGDVGITHRRRQLDL